MTDAISLPSHGYLKVEWFNNNMTSTGTAGPYNVINENYKKIYG